MSHRRRGDLIAGTGRISSSGHHSQRGLPDASGRLLWLVPEIDIRPFRQFYHLFFIIHQVERLRDAEIVSDISLAGDHDIAWVYVSVDNTQWTAQYIAFFSVGEPASKHGDNKCGYIAGDGLISLPVSLDEVLKRNAINVLHCHIVLPADFTEMIGLYNVGMDQVGDQLGFADEVTTKLIYFGVFFTD